MTKPKQVDSKEVGLAVGLIFGKYFLKTEHMHYGYWPADLALDISNVAQAQEKYTEFLLSHIPEFTETVLDVGCGTGATAKKLKDTGYSVECVSPSDFLTGYAHDLLGDECTIYQCTFENLNTDKRYDLLLFSESFQYVGLDEVLINSSKYLNENGHLMICDFFRRGGEIKSFMGGGHNIDEFYDR
ncbi:MAG: class I SAM-dependent methyltransferase, partial [bacterium]